MVVVEIAFLTGRYHSTPWGRNVNEGVPEWPPSPFRIARALFDVWKRKIPELPAMRFINAIKLLSGTPVFDLPPVSYSHVRLWQSSNKKNPLGRQMIFDPFVACERSATARIGFETSASEEATKDLSSLLDRLTYLGRSESWVLARLGSEIGAQESWNFKPVEEGTLDNPAQVGCLRSPENWTQQDTWLDSLGNSTEDMVKEGWNHPPYLMWIPYRYEENINQKNFKIASTRKLHVYSAFYALASKVLPRVEETLPLAERVRVKILGINRKICDGDPSRVSLKFIGKDEEGKPLKDHKHSFFQPLDMNGDGKLDHFLVYGTEPFDPTELRVLDLFRSIWQPEGKPDLNFVLVSVGGTIFPRKSRVWESTTPFVTTRHYRKGRGDFWQWLQNEVRRECSVHNLPEPVSVKPIERPRKGGGKGWWAFKRNRKGETPLPGYGFRLEFEHLVEGIFSLGALCHFGLGLFLPADGHSISEKTASADLK